MTLPDTYTVKPFPLLRRFSVDGGQVARHKYIVHGLLEVDVTRARQILREHKARTGEALSFTAFVIGCLSQAVERNKAVQAYRTWRNQLIIFDDVNVNTIIESEAGGEKIAAPHVIRAANRKTLREIHAEIRAAQAKPANTREVKFMRLFLQLPGFLRHAFYWFVSQYPQRVRAYTSNVLITAVGMFGQGAGWGIPAANFALTVTLGGISEKPGVIQGRIEVREYLCVTLSFDHEVTDGAPAARFTQQFRELIESGYGLDDDPPGADTPGPQAEQAAVSGA